VTRRFGAVWGMPVLLAVLTSAGLLCALVGDGWWDQVGALALATPVAAGAWYGLRRAPMR
jgi:hypothetical protein